MKRGSSWDPCATASRPPIPRSRSRRDRTPRLPAPRSRRRGERVLGQLRRRELVGGQVLEVAGRVLVLDDDVGLADDLRGSRSPRSRAPAGRRPWTRRLRALVAVEPVRGQQRPLGERAAMLPRRRPRDGPGDALRAGVTRRPTPRPPRCGRARASSSARLPRPTRDHARSADRPVGMQDRDLLEGALRLSRLDQAAELPAERLVQVSGRPSPRTGRRRGCRPRSAGVHWRKEARTGRKYRSPGSVLSFQSAANTTNRGSDRCHRP